MIDQFSILALNRIDMVYIHADSDRKLPHNFDAACALYGAIESVQDVRLTTIEEVVSGKFDTLIRKRLFAGSVEFMQAVFTRVGATAHSLNYLKEDYVHTTLSDVRRRVNQGEIWFVKPVYIKLFTGMVFDAGTIMQLSSYPDDVEVLISEPYDSPILSETRCYVNKNKIIDARNYAGDFRIQPDWDQADLLVRSFRSTPCAFTVDIGVLENSLNVVIEYNDMWAIGNYGLENAEYFRLLKERYFEIMETV
jgi:hypothetical protein